MKNVCPHCGKKFITKECTDAHILKEHVPELVPIHKRKVWGTPHGFIEFTSPVTYEQACERARSLVEDMKGL